MASESKEAALPLPEASSEVPEESGGGGKGKGPIRALYDWCIKWSRTKYAIPALFGMSFAEASFFPIPPDVLLLAMSFAQPKKAFKYAAWCTAASVIGGMFGYYIGLELWHIFSTWFIPRVFSQAAFDKAQALYVGNAFWIIVGKGFTPIPFKLVTISAGVAQVPFGLFVGASVICRSIRFFLVAGLIYFFGERIRPFVEKYLTWLMLAALVLLVGGFAAIKMFK